MTLTNRFDAFSRVHGSGTFDIDAFTMVTGINADKAVPILRKQEKAGKVITLSPGFFLLKPVMTDSYHWNDWAFNEEKVKAIYDACCDWTPVSAMPQMGKITLRRYLAAMLITGLLKKRRFGAYVKFMAKKPYTPITATYKQLKRR